MQLSQLDIVVKLELVAARLVASGVSADTITSMTIAGGLLKTDVDSNLVPAWQQGLTLRVQRDCTMLASPPGCGCATDTEGKYALLVFDADPKDCAISVDEVASNPLIVSLLVPDLTIDGQPALSLGVHATATNARFAGP